MRLVKLEKGDFVLKDKAIGFIVKTVTPYGNGGKVDCPKRYIGKKAYLVICR